MASFFKEMSDYEEAPEDVKAESRIKKIKTRINANKDFYVHCGLRDPVSFSQNPLTTLDWYTALIASQASEAAYGVPPELLKYPNIKSGLCTPVYPVDTARKPNGKDLLLNLFPPPVISLDREYLSRLEDLLSYLKANSSSDKNFFLDNKKSDLQAWYCELKTPLSKVFQDKVISCNKASTDLAAAFLDNTNDERNKRTQIILAFRGTQGMQDVGTDVSGLKVPLTWHGEADSPSSTSSSVPSRLALLASAAGAAALAYRGSPILGAAMLGAAGLALYCFSQSVAAPDGLKMAEAYENLKPEDIKNLVQQGSNEARKNRKNRLAKACASLFKPKGDTLNALLSPGNRLNLSRKLRVVGCRLLPPPETGGSAQRIHEDVPIHPREDPRTPGQRDPLCQGTG
jgi:hypothetical protein